MRSKKSQMEMLGLVMIVILIALAMTFTLQFIILKKPSEIRKIYTHSKLSSNILNTLLKTSTDCRELDFAALLQDCAANKNTPYIVICENNRNSCSHAEEKINEIFSNTLRKWNIAFEFDVDLADINIKQGDCLGEKQSKLYPIPTDIGIMTLKLDICS